MKKLCFACLLSLCAATASAEHIVQLGAFKNHHLAREQMASAALVGVRTYIQTLHTAGGTLYRVRTAPMPRPDAERLMQHLHRQQMNAILMER